MILLQVANQDMGIWTARNVLIVIFGGGVDPETLIKIETKGGLVRRLDMEVDESHASLFACGLNDTGQQKTT